MLYCCCRDVIVCVESSPPPLRCYVHNANELPAYGNDVMYDSLRTRSKQMNEANHTSTTDEAMYSTPESKVYTCMCARAIATPTVAMYYNVACIQCSVHIDI